MKITLNSQESEINDLQKLLQRVNAIVDQHAEISLFMTEDKPILIVLKSDDRALIMFLRFSGDVGFTSRSNYPEQLLDFTVSGQKDQYPGNWTIPYEEAKKVIAYFFDHQEMLPSVLWHDDSQS